MNNKYNLLPLYPQSNDIYDNEADLLFQSFADPKIKNIGIVAPYGAGKSSLIETFKQKYSNKKISNISPKLRFLDLTLASFNSESQIDSSKELNACSKGENFNNSMEKSILQQMLYKKEKKDLPASNIKRVSNFILSKFLVYLLITILMFVFIYTTIIFFENLKGTNIFSFINWNIVYPIVAIITLVLIVGLITRTFSISKIAIKDIEIDINEKNESLLNKYLDEVIYFFQKTKYNVVILEDLDRFDNLNIFIKLRELNIALNQNLKIQKKCGPIRFVYAVRSDIFQSSEERAKFFDIIFTVFPVLSPINTRDMIENALNKSGLGTNWLSKSFINDISFFIKDMRVLNSIINDCVIFIISSDYESINIEPLEKNIQLFAFMTYKDTQPKEFAELQCETGELYDLLKLAQYKLDQIRSELKQEINTIDKQCINSSSQSQQSNTLKLIQDKKITTDKMNKLPEPIAYLQNNFKEVIGIKKTTDILKMLICNGYLTDRFKEFLNISTEKSFLSKNDELFIKRVLMLEKPDFSAIVDNVDFVVEDLSVDKFLRKSILNYIVIDYLFNHNNKVPEKFEAVKQLLKTEDGDVKTFLYHYIEQEDDIAKVVISFIVEERDDAFSMILSSETPIDVAVRLSKQILIETKEEQISKQQKLFEFISFLEDNAAVIEYLKLTDSKLSFLKQQNFKIKNLRDCDFTTEVLKIIEKYNFWDINYANVIYLLMTLYNKTEENIEKKGYSLILLLSNKETSSYILSDLSHYVHNVMLKAESIDLEEKDFKQLIIHNELTDDDKKSIISKQITPVSYWSQCPQNILKTLLSANKIILTESQIQSFAQTPDLADDLAIYLMNNREKHVGKLQINSALVLLIANSILTINNKSLLEIYYDERMNQYLSSLTSIDNDLSLAFIISKNIKLSFKQEDYNHIIGHKIAEKTLCEGDYIKHIIEMHFLTNDLAHIGIKYSHDKEIRAQLYLFDKWNFAQDKYDFVNQILNDIYNNKYKISTELYEQFENFPNIDKVKLLKSQLQFMKKDDLCIKLKSIPRYFDLFEKGKIECTYFEIEDSDIIDLLCKETIVKKRKWKGKIFLYLEEQDELQLIGNY